MAMRRPGLLAMLPLVGIAACAQTPLGPMVQVVPGPRKSFETFQADGAGCQQYAQGAVAGQAELANNRAIGGAVLSTVLGAGLGAAVGGGRGAGIGAAAGAGLGAAGGTGYSANAQGPIQAQYDNAYGQCMYSHGHRVAGLPDPVPERQVVQQRYYRRAPVQVRQSVRAQPAPNWVAPSSVAQDGGTKSLVSPAKAE